MIGYTIIKGRYSDCLEFTAVDVLNARCIVRFKKSGDEYLYRNVSRRRLLSLLTDGNKSLGFWIQYLRRNAISSSTSLKGKMTYERVGCTYNSRELPKLLLA
jgi:hypothetical protein